MDTNERDEITVPDALVQFFRAPFRLRTYTNLLYLALPLYTTQIYARVLTSHSHGTSRRIR